MNYLFSLVLLGVVFGVLVLSTTFVPYYGVISLIMVSLFCCLFMVTLGRSYYALIMYIVYLGGLVVVFGYCVSVEKDNSLIFIKSGSNYYFMLMLTGISLLWFSFLDGVGDLLIYSGWEDLVWMEVNGGGVFYFVGGIGLVVCSWGLLVVLFSILVILSWSRLGGLRPF
nr:NADH dehydrogenase subunit 6 [Pseudagkistrodon rudis]